MLFAHSNRNTVLVTFDEEKVKYCRDLGWGRKKYDIWGEIASEQNKEYRKAPLNDDPKDRSRAERIGVYGEKAFSLLTGLPVDETISDRGDKWDFVIPGKEIKVDVKTHSILYDEKADKENKYGPFFITATNGFGKPKTLYPDYYCFVVIAEHNGTTKSNRGFITDKNATKVVVEVYGLISKESILANKEKRIGSPMTNKKGSNWKNYYIKEEELEDPILFMWKHRNVLTNGKIDLFI
jgi:hypothetical protein